MIGVIVSAAIAVAAAWLWRISKHWLQEKEFMIIFVSGSVILITVTSVTYMVRER